MFAFLLLSPFVAAPVAVWLAGRYRRAAALLAAWPALLALVLGAEFRSVLQDGPRLVQLPWAPALGLTLSFNLDGLGLLFALLITAMGALVVLYASAISTNTRRRAASTARCSPSWARCWASPSATTS